MPLSLPADLAQTAVAFTHWRSTTPVGARISTDRWAQAVALAARHGVSKVAATLRLDYAGLKQYQGDLRSLLTENFEITGR